jgi:hypothetical protein
MAATNVQIDGAWSLQLTNTSFHGRQHDLALLVAGASGDPTVARSGVMPRTSVGGVCQDYLVKQRSDVGSLKVDILPGAAVINRASQGPYLLYNSATRTPQLANADSTNARIDRIVLHAYDIALGDSNPNSAGTYAAYIEVVTGTPAGSPVAPAVPTNCMSLAQCRVPANAANSNLVVVTPERASAGINGASRWMLEADITTPPTAYLDGEATWVEGSGGTSGLMRMWSAGSWVDALRFGAHAAYTPTVTMQTANGTATGRYWRSGNKVSVDFAFTASSGVSLGTGAITVSLPFTSVNVGNNHSWIGSAVIGGGTGYMTDAVLGGNASIATLFTRNTTTGAVSNPGVAGVTFAAGNYISGNIEYECQ